MPKRILTGTVVSDKGDKTVVVKVERKVKHPLYGKIIRRSKKYHAHDEDNAIKAGETADHGFIVFYIAVAKELDKILSHLVDIF